MFRRALAPHMSTSITKEHYLMICRYTEGKRGREREREQRTRMTERKKRQKARQK